MKIIDPLKTPKLIWNGLIIVLVTYSAILIPFTLAFSIGLNREFQILDFVIDFIFFLDIYLNFHTSYSKNGRDITNKKQIALHYLATWFAIDLLATVPFDNILPIIIPSLAAFAPKLALLRLLRIIRVFRYIQDFNKVFYINPAIMRIIKLTYLTFLYIHGMACVWFYVGIHAPPTHENWLLDSGILSVPTYDQYIRSFYWVLTTMTTVGYGDITPSTTFETLLAMIIMIVGVSIYAYIIGNMASFIANIDASATFFRNKLQAINNYARYHRLPKALQQHVIDYYQQMWTRHKKYDGTSIMQDLPESLRQDIAMFLNRDVINKVPLFHDCEPGVLHSLVMMLQPEIHLPNDFIIHEGEMGNAMYFLTDGEVQILINDNKTVCATLGPGNFFGEVALLFSQKRTASVQATTFTELFVLTKEDFNKILQTYPKFAESIRKTAAERYKTK